MAAIAQALPLVFSSSFLQSSRASPCPCSSFDARFQCSFAGCSVRSSEAGVGVYVRGLSTHWPLFDRLQKRGLQATGDPGRAALSTNEERCDDFPPPGCTRIKVELNKPLGIVLEEDKAGNIFVAELVKDGNADKSGLIEAGDQLIATSAIVYGTEDYYQGVKVRKGMQVVRLSVYNEKFETVMAAIGTHPAHVKVTLEVQKCKKPTTESDSNGAT